MFNLKAVLQSVSQMLVTNMLQYVIVILLIVGILTTT